MKYAEIGSISTGTLKIEDLLKTFSNQLDFHLERNRSELPMVERRTMAKLIYDANEPMKDEEDAHFLLTEIQDALELFAPPGAYFGAHEGDGADFGFWPGEDPGHD